MLSEKADGKMLKAGIQMDLCPESVTMYRYMTMNRVDRIELLTNTCQGENWLAMVESIEYIDRLVAHIYSVKYLERLPRYSVKAAAEYLRWRTTAGDNSVLFKVNNNLSSEINHWMFRVFPNEVEGFLSKRQKD